MTPACVSRIATVATPLALVVLALAVRLVNLDQFTHLVFDETYYVKDAYSLWQHGFETKWGDEPNPAFEAGNDSAMTDEPSFVVHPPLGKWVLGIGTALFGIDSVWAWRMPVVLVGVALVLVTYFVARGITRSTLWGGLAGLLIALDSQAIVMSRTVLLDSVLALFVLLGVGVMFLDRRGAPARLIRQLHRDRGSWHPAFLWRPWLMLAGAAFGAAAATKWSGLYFMAAFGLWSVTMDVIDQWRAHGRAVTWLGFLTQGPVSFLLFVVPALAVFMASYIGWFTRGGYYRDWGVAPENRVAWLPDWLGPDLHSFFHYQLKTYEFHVGLTKDHAFQSPAIEWLLMLRPTGFASDSHDDGAVVQYVSAMPNPFIWWAGTAAILIGLFLFGRTLNAALGATLLAIAAGYVPWLLYPERTIFSFYTIVYTPFIVILIVLLLRWLVIGLPGRPTGPEWRVSASILVLGYFVFVVAAYLFWSPVTYGYPIDAQWMRLRYWLPGWR